MTCRIRPHFVVTSAGARAPGACERGHVNRGADRAVGVSQGVSDRAAGALLVEPVETPGAGFRQAQPADGTSLTGGQGVPEPAIEAWNGSPSTISPDRTVASVNADL